MYQRRIVVIVTILAAALALLTVSLALAQEGVGRSTADAGAEAAGDSATRPKNKPSTSAVILDGAALPTKPGIAFTKSVGTDPAVCASTDTINVLPGTSVTYCYKASNTGSVTQTRHDLGDSELGRLLAGFPFSLQPGASVWLTQSATIKSTTVNTAT